MDCLGKEVTNKMKSAIMAKLMELGISADEDLLDYIMLMISNKRSKAGMSRDLSLFLGTNTVPFVTWLHQVLSKLQEVTISTQVGQTKTKKAESVTSEKVLENAETKVSDNIKCKKRERTPSGEEQDYLNIRADTEADPIDDLQNVIDESSAKISVPEQNFSTHSSEEKELERTSEKQASNKGKDSQSTKALSGNSEKRKLVEEQSKDDGGMKRKRVSPPEKEREKDEGDSRKRRLSPQKSRETSKEDFELKRKRFSPPLMKEREDSESRRKEKDKDKDHRVKDGERKLSSESGRRDKGVYDVRELLNRRKAEKTESRETEKKNQRRKSPAPVRRPVRERDRERMRERVHEREKGKRSSSRELSSDRRRPPSKVVRVAPSGNDGSDARSGRSNVSERGRGRTASSVGGDSAARDSDRERDREATVPSVVKVTPRPVRLPSQQPSSSLILKAMAEANKSLAKQGTTKTAQSIMNRKADTVLRGRISPEKITVTLTNNRVQPLTTEDKENKLYVPSNGRDESYERLKQSRAMVKRAAIEDAKRKETQAEMVTENGNVERIENETDSIGGKKLVDEDEDEVELDIVVDPRLEYECELEEEENSSRVERREGKRSDSATNSSPTSRSLSFVSDNGKANDAVKKWLRTTDGHKEKLSQETDQDSEPVLEICPNTSELDVEEPEFVVTLNGLNSSMYSCLSDDDEDLQQSSRYDHNFNEDLEKRNRSANIVIEPDETSKQDMSQTEPVETTQSSTAVIKSLDRCRFWPNCLAGDKCSYFHPTTMCKMFPSCKYGDHCLFIHPPCKFGVACTRRDCAYKHPAAPPLLAAKASVVSVMTSSTAITSCRFYPNCTNPACPFYHPKPCRFGTYCSKKNCPFDHSVRHSKDKLKWIRTE